MNEELTWKVRHEVAVRGSRQKAPAKACFYWKKDGQLVRSAEFTQPELEVEIERWSAAGADITQFVLALKLLALSRGSKPARNEQRSIERSRESAQSLAAQRETRRDVVRKDRGRDGGKAGAKSELRPAQKAQRPAKTESAPHQALQPQPKQKRPPKRQTGQKQASSI
jgi:hypothetical protein